MASPPWYRAVLGAELARWTHDGASEAADGGSAAKTATTTDGSSLKPGSSVGYALVPVDEALGEADVVALYFPPLLGDDLTDRLVELHRAVNKQADDNDTVDKDGNKVGAAAAKVDKADRVDQDGNRVAGMACKARARLRVVQVLTPLPPAAASPAGPAPQHVHVPWFAVPPEDYDRQVSSSTQGGFLRPSTAERGSAARGWLRRRRIYPSREKELKKFGEERCRR